MAWWVWILVGLGLLGFEILTPGGFFVLFFGLGAIVVGALTGLGLTGPAWVQWLLFSLLSVGSLLLFRPRLGAVAALLAAVGRVAAPLPPPPGRAAARARWSRRRQPRRRRRGAPRRPRARGGRQGRAARDGVVGAARWTGGPAAWQALPR